jgi:hypothetical protein
MVESMTTGCAIQPRGSAMSLARSVSSSAGEASGPTTSPLPPEPSTGLIDEFVEAVEHLFERVGLFEPPRVDVLQDRLFGEVIADQVGHVRVEQLVVGDAVADGVGDRDVAQTRAASRPARRASSRRGTAAGRGSRRRPGGR